MVARQSEFGRAVSRLIGWLAVPRRITLPLLLSIGVGASQFIWWYVDSVKILAWLSGLATPFCMMCATVVWSLRDRIDGTIDADLLTSEQYRKLVELTNKHRAKSTALAARTALAALVSAMPAVSNQLIGPVWQSMVLAAGGAVSYSIYAYLIANSWDHEIRAKKNKDRYESKKQRENEELASMLRLPVKVGTQFDIDEGPDLLGPSQAHH